MKLIDDKDRKNPLASKSKALTMMEFFEKYYDETILSVSLERSCVQTRNGCYRVDIKNNKIEKMFRTELKMIDNSDF
jgi:hypothetical protein